MNRTHHEVNKECEEQNLVPSKVDTYDVQKETNSNQTIANVVEVLTDFL